MKFSAKSAGSTLEMMMYGAVGDDWQDDGITYRAVARALRENPDAKTIKIRLNSFGGDAHEGHAIRSLLQASGRRIEIAIDGVAASAATVISTAADHLSMAADAQFMIHNASAVVMGSRNEIESSIKALENLDDAMAYVYAARTGRSLDEVRAWMDAETWFTADQARTHNFVDEVTPAKQLRAQASAKGFKFKAMPQELHVSASSATVAPDTRKNMTDEQFKALQESLAALTGRLDAIEAKASATPAAPPPAPEPDPEVEVDEPASAADAEVKAMFASAVNARFDGFVALGKLTPASRESFVAAAATPSSFGALCKLYDAQAAAAVSTAAIGLPNPGAPLKKHSATPTQEKFCADAGLDVCKLFPIQGSK